MSTDDIARELRRRVQTAAIHLVNSIKENLNTAAPNRRRSVGANGGVYYRADHSPSGSLPWKITGFLQRSISYELSADGLSAKVGSTLKGPNAYSAHLEFGTSKMPGGRPWLRPTLAQERQTLERILAGG